ncbi:MAG: hypothetical protein WD004_08305 [Actinomycetota bacterium]
MKRLLAILVGVAALGPAPAFAVVPPNCGVDATIAPMGGAEIGAGVVDPTGASQRVRVRARRAKLRLFIVDATNTGAEADAFALDATVDAPSTAVMVSDGPTDATSDAQAGVYASAPVAASATHRFVIWMRPFTTGPYGDVRSVTLAVSCKGAASPPDTVIAEIKVRR